MDYTECQQATAAERSSLEEALRQSEARFRHMADTVPGLIWMSDIEPLITFVNRHGAELTGKSEKELMGTGWLDIIHPDDSESVISHYLNGYASRQPWT